MKSDQNLITWKINRLKISSMLHLWVFSHYLNSKLTEILKGIQLYNFLKIIFQKKTPFNIDMSANFLQSVFRYHCMVLALVTHVFVCIGHHLRLAHKMPLLFWCFLTHYVCQIWRVERSGLHPENVNESTEFIMLAITNTYMLYIYNIPPPTLSEGEASTTCKDYFPICPSESTQTNGTNGAEVQQCQRAVLRKIATNS